MTVVQQFTFSYLVIAVLIAVGMTAVLEQQDVERRGIVLTHVVFCVFWPLIPVFVALMKWDINRREQKNQDESP